MTGPEDSVRYHLHRLLAREEEVRYSTDYIHASEVTSEDPEFCPREMALYDVTGRRGWTQPIGAASQFVFDLGHAIQGLITRYMQETGMAYGNWRCSVCDRSWGMQRRPSRCSVCGGVSTVEYEEPRFLSAVSGISGGMDLLVQLPGRDLLVLVEVKGLRRDDFRKLVAPLAEHRVRTRLYLRAIAEAQDPAALLVDSEEARLLYVCKGGWGEKDVEVLRWGDSQGWSPFKEFVVERDDESCEVYHRKAKAVTDFRRGTTGMPEGICPTQFAPRAKGCPVVHQCFGGHYPPGWRPSG